MTRASTLESLYVVDLDGDGDLDVVPAMWEVSPPNSFQYVVPWHENKRYTRNGTSIVSQVLPGGKTAMVGPASFIAATAVGTTPFDNVVIGDVNGDGRPDMVVEYHVGDYATPVVLYNTFNRTSPSQVMNFTFVRGPQLGSVPTLNPEASGEWCLAG